jgi:hypothetical protein
MSMENNVALVSIAGILERHDKYKGDVSSRAEGTFEAVEMLARAGGVSDETRDRVARAIVECCKHYGQSEQIGRGPSAVDWPTNRFAIAALKSLGKERPAA